MVANVLTIGHSTRTIETFLDMLQAHGVKHLTDVRTVPVGAIAELVRGDVFYWGQLMAAALLGSIPVAIIYSFFVEHYVAGLTSGGVKA